MFADWKQICDFNQIFNASSFELTFVLILRLRFCAVFAKYYREIIFACCHYLELIVAHAVYTFINTKKHLFADISSMFHRYAKFGETKTQTTECIPKKISNDWEWMYVCFFLFFQLELHWWTNRNVYCFNVCLISKKKQLTISWGAFCLCQNCVLFVLEFHKFGLFSTIHINHRQKPTRVRWWASAYIQSNFLNENAAAWNAIPKMRRRIGKYSKEEKKNRKKSATSTNNKVMRTERIEAVTNSLFAFFPLVFHLWKCSIECEWMAWQGKLRRRLYIYGPNELAYAAYTFIRMHKYTQRFK